MAVANVDALSPLPLSLSQREVWMDQRAWPGSAHLNIGGGAYLEGPLDRHRLRLALQRLVAECEALRLVPSMEGTTGGQRLLEVWQARLTEIDVSGTDEPREAMRQDWEQRIREPFALGQQPPWRFFLYRASDTLHGLSIQFHHLVMDGWGTTQVMRRWSEHYQAITRGEDAPEADLGYRRYIEDSLAYRQSPAWQRDAAFWRERFARIDAAQGAPLMENRYRLPVEGGLPPAHLVRHRIPAAEYREVSRLLSAQGHTIAAALLAAMVVYFGRCCRREQLVVAVPSMNRPGARLKQLPGMTVGLLALPLAWQAQQSGAELLADTTAQLHSSLRHARYPLSALAQELGLMRQGRDRIADLLLSVERQDFQLAFDQASLRHSRQLFAGQARYALATTLCEFGADADPEIALEGSSACFEADELPLLARRLWRLTLRLAQHPLERLGEIDLLLPEEGWAMSQGLHQDLARRERPPPFIASFEHHAALNPEAPALVWEHDGGTRTLCYRELDEAAESLAGRLRSHLPGPRALVALALPRGAGQVISLLACAKSAAAFLPLDTEAPLPRIAQVLEDSGASLMVVDAQTPASWSTLPVPRLDLRERTAVAPPAVTAPVRAQPEDLAYVLYTSGSTGRPKGVMVEHLALSRRLAWLARAWAITPADRSLQTTQLLFDPALIEVLMPLTQGASIALPPAGRQHPRRLAETLLRLQASFCALVPTTLAGLLDGLEQHSEAQREACRLRVACCGGEVLAPALAQRFHQQTGAQLYNLYGPTEATIFATAWPCDDTERILQLERLPLGKPVDDTLIRVLDEHLQPLPLGVSGEICIGGGALARGYLNRPELDREQFVQDPLALGHRLYRTGDRGWLDARGQLHFFGRQDRQIKLRGYRIELGDIEAACLALPGVREAWVAPLSLAGAPRLHAWLGVGADPGPAETSQLLDALRERLPDHMVPTSLSLLPSLPQLPNGKIDARALPLPETRHSLTRASREPSELERQLQLLWRSHLPDGRLPGLDENFFELGGDSLGALSVLAELEQSLGRSLSLQLMADHPDIAGLARAIQRQGQAAGMLVMLDPGSAGPAEPMIYLAASGHGDVLRLQTLARALRGRARLAMLQPPREAVSSMADLAQHYASLLAGCEAGWLAGFSVGGVTALETARGMQDAGHPPLGLLLLDTLYPNPLLGGGLTWRAFAWLVRALHVQDLSLNGRRLGTMFSDAGLVAQVMALRGHRLRAWDGPTWLIQSSGLVRWERFWFRPWQRLLGAAFRGQRVVGGLHGSIFEASQVDELADTIVELVRDTSPAG